MDSKKLTISEKKYNATEAAARLIIAGQVAARREKTSRLEKQRLEKQAAEANTKRDGAIGSEMSPRRPANADKIRLVECR